MKKLFVSVSVILSLLGIITFLSGCSEDAKASEEKHAITISCTVERSEVKWFYGEICPIDSRGFLSVGLNMSGSNRTVGCVTLKNVCSVTP